MQNALAPVRRRWLKVFNVEGKSIRLTAGDTAAIVINVGGYTFTENDAVIFTIKSTSGDVVIYRECHPDANGDILVCFYNSETEGWGAGVYRWDIRAVIHAYRDATGKIVNGDQVITPFEPQTFELLAPVGTV